MAIYIGGIPPVSERPDTSYILEELGKDLEILEVSNRAIWGWEKRWVKIRGQWKLLNPKTMKLSAVPDGIVDVVPVPVREYRQEYWVRYKNLWGIFSVSQGKFVFPPTFSEVDVGDHVLCGECAFALVWVCQKGRWGCFNTTTLAFHIEPTHRTNPKTTGLIVTDQKEIARVVLPFEYDTVKSFIFESTQGSKIQQYLVTKKGAMGLIGFDDKNKPVTLLECKWLSIRPLPGSNDWDSWTWAFAVQNRDKKWGLYKNNQKESKMLVPCRYDSVGMFKAADYKTYIVLKKGGRMRFYYPREEKFLL